MNMGETNQSNLLLRPIQIPRPTPKKDEIKTPTIKGLRVST